MVLEQNEQQMQVHQVATRRKRNRLVTALNEAHPTPERMRHAGGDYEQGDDRQGTKILTMRDSPLERAQRRGVITSEQYNAGIKFRHHWYRAGLVGSSGNSDLCRVFGNPFSGFNDGEAHAFHLQQYRKAVQVVGKIGSRVLDEVVARETSLEQMGYLLGWGSKPQAIAVATVHLQLALDALVREWGMR